MYISQLLGIHEYISFLERLRIINCYGVIFVQKTKVRAPDIACALDCVTSSATEIWVFFFSSVNETYIKYNERNKLM